MDSLTETIRATRRLQELGDECQAEADRLMEHYRAGRVGETVLDPVSTLVSAAQRADREALTIVTFGDENDLLRADIVAEEITRLLRRERTWRTALDEIHGIDRESTP